jgi:hypothetical protein
MIRHPRYGTPLALTLTVALARGMTSHPNRHLSCFYARLCTPNGLSVYRDKINRVRSGT